MVDSPTTPRRGDAEGTVLAAIVIVIIIIGGVLLGVGNWYGGYRAGQIDAANGKVSVVQVVGEDGNVYWYNIDKPKRLYRDRSHD